jgi:hypothetical protein
MNHLKSQQHIIHVLKNTKPQARRAILASASDGLIKTIVECAIYKLNGNHKLTKGEKCELSEYKNRFRELGNPKISFKNKCIP